MSPIYTQVPGHIPFDQIVLSDTVGSSQLFTVSLMLHHGGAEEGAVRPAEDPGPLHIHVEAVAQACQREQEDSGVKCSGHKPQADTHCYSCSCVGDADLRMQLGEGLDWPQG